MTAAELFQQLVPRIGPAIETNLKRRDLCVFGVRVAMEVARYFGIEVQPVACQVAIYNRAFAMHIDEGDYDLRKWISVDGSYSIGIGFGHPPVGSTVGRWNGHLIAVADRVFADFSIWQAERPQHGIIIGPGLMGPYSGAKQWTARNMAGVRIEYSRMEDEAYRRSPDWRSLNRRMKIAGALIRELKTCKEIVHHVQWSIPEL